MEVEYTIPLNVVGKALSAKIIIKREGQVAASKSDNVKVMCKLYLPSTEEAGHNSSSLQKKIEFDNRLILFGGSLYSLWGEYRKGGNYRYKKLSFSGDSFSKLFEEAKKYAFSEVKKINNLLDARRQAYLDAN